MDVSKIAPYAKAVVALGGVVVLAAKSVSDGILSADELLQIGVALAVAFGVYQVPNKEIKK